jgi:hypothetical protein
MHVCVCEEPVRLTCLHLDLDLGPERVALRQLGEHPAVQPVQNLVLAVALWLYVHDGWKNGV